MWGDGVITRPGTTWGTASVYLHSTTHGVNVTRDCHRLFDTLSPCCGRYADYNVTVSSFLLLPLEGARGVGVTACSAVRLIPKRIVFSNVLPFVTVYLTFPRTLPSLFPLLPFFPSSLLPFFPSSLLPFFPSSLLSFFPSVAF